MSTYKTDLFVVRYSATNSGLISFSDASEVEQEVPVTLLEVNNQTPNPLTVGLPGHLTDVMRK
jgi:hypothetical protein